MGQVPTQTRAGNGAALHGEGRAARRQEPAVSLVRCAGGLCFERLVIGEGEQRRVYIVTTDAPAEYAWIHDRWPLLTGSG